MLHTSGRGGLRASGVSGLLMISVNLAACAGEKAEPEPTEPVQAPISIDVRRSLMITDEEILEPFAFRRVMAVLSGGSADEPPSAAALALFHQWWDTQNDASSAVGDGPHCDAEMVDGAPAMNGYPLLCPRAEGRMASVDPFEETLPDGEVNPDFYFPIGLANRFDLATTDGASCGEYRILYAKRSAPEKRPGDRNLIIFEGGLPNPRPDLGLEGCRPVAEHVARLSTLDAAARAAELEGFFFEGLPGFEPVVAPSHYNGAMGHIRSNQFIAAETEAWTLKDFMVLEGEDGARIVPLPVVNSPFVELFDAASTDPRAAAFREHFVTQIPSLAMPDMERFFMQIPAEFLPGESISSFTGLQINPLEESSQADYLRTFNTGAETDDSFRVAIQEELTALGSSLTPEHIVKRALTQSCAGCHQISGGALIQIGPPPDGQPPDGQPGGPPPGGPPPPLVGDVERRDLGDGLQWSTSLGFVHVSEEEFLREPGEDAGDRYLISAALKERFLPHRKQVLEQFLAGGVPSDASGGDGTLGGHPSEH